MGLVDLKTNLKNLKTSFSNIDTTAVLKDITTAVRTGVVSEFTRRKDDVIRVTKAMLPANSRFLLNQTLLSKVKFASQIESLKRNDGKTTVGAFIKTVKDVSLTPLTIAASTIAATAASGTGLRFVRGFKRGDHGHLASQAQSRGKVTLTGDKRISYFKDINDYSDEFGVKSSDPYVKFGGKNTEDRTAAGIILVGSTSTAERFAANSTVAGGGRLLIPSSTPSAILKDWRGNRLTKTSIIQNYNLPKERELFRSNYGRVEDENQPNFGLPEGGSAFYSTLKDFRSLNPGYTGIFFDYSSATVDKHQRVGIGRKGFWNKEADYTLKSGPKVVDTLNAIDVQPVKLESTAVESSMVRDFIKFRFEVLRPGKPSTFLYFRALLESFDDNFNGNWSDTNYIGRGDAVRTYNGFSRTVSLSFKIAATTRREMKSLYKKMVYLASTTAPTYGEDGSFMKGTLVRMTIGNYIYEVAGTMDSVRYSWRENYPWDIAVSFPKQTSTREVISDEGEISFENIVESMEIKDDMQELPHIMDCSINFTPIHDFVPQTGLYHYITSPKDIENSKTFFTSGQEPIKKLLDAVDERDIKA